MAGPDDTVSPRGSSRGWRVVAAPAAVAGERHDQGTGPFCRRVTPGLYYLCDPEHLELTPFSPSRPITPPLSPSPSLPPPFFLRMSPRAGVSDSMPDFEPQVRTGMPIPAQGYSAAPIRAIFWPARSPNQELSTMTDLPVPPSPGRQYPLSAEDIRAGEQYADDARSRARRAVRGRSRPRSLGGGARWRAGSWCPAWSPCVMSSTRWHPAGTRRATAHRRRGPRADPVGPQPRRDRNTPYEDADHTTRWTRSTWTRTSASPAGTCRRPWRSSSSATAAATTTACRT